MVYVEFVPAVRQLVLHQALSEIARGTGEFRRSFEWRPRGVMNFAVPVFVNPCQQTCPFPALKPGRDLFISGVSQAGHHIISAERGHGRRGSIQKGDKEKSVRDTKAGLTYSGHIVAPAKNVGQSRRSEHKGQGHKNHVQEPPLPRTKSGCVLRKAKLLIHSVQYVQKSFPGFRTDNDRSAISQLRHWLAGEAN